ncbi:hypothetical protein J0S82_016569, partial [Galemys pyrenaicus]
RWSDYSFRIGRLDFSKQRFCISTWTGHSRINCLSPVQPVIIAKVTEEKGICYKKTKQGSSAEIEKSAKPTHDLKYSVLLPAEFSSEIKTK